MKNKTFDRTFLSGKSEATASNTPRRTTHGGSGWMLPLGGPSLRQPQDGSFTNSGVNVSGVVRPIDGRSSNTGIEAEDARLNGSLRSLACRVKGLNVMKKPTDVTPTYNQSVELISRKTPETSRNSAASHSQVA